MCFPADIGYKDPVGEESRWPVERPACRPALSVFGVHEMSTRGNPHLLYVEHHARVPDPGVLENLGEREGLTREGPIVLGAPIQVVLADSTAAVLVRRRVLGDHHRLPNAAASRCFPVKRRRGWHVRAAGKTESAGESDRTGSVSAKGRGRGIWLCLVYRMVRLGGSIDRIPTCMPD